MPGTHLKAECNCDVHVRKKLPFGIPPRGLCGIYAPEGRSAPCRDEYDEVKGRSENTMTKLKRLLLVCGVVSSVLYIAVDILGTLRYPGYSYTVQEFSELTAAGAPTRDLMVALNVIPYDLLVAAFEVGV